MARAYCPNCHSLQKFIPLGGNLWKCSRCGMVFEDKYQRGDNLMPKIEVPSQFGELPPFIRPNDIQGNEAKLKIVSPHRTLPNGNAVIDVEYKKKKYTFGYLNKTNLTRLIKMFGDDTDKWVGKTFTVIKALAINPSTKGEVETLRVKVE